mmetsp:Transcript_17199/g.56986  ORF Transcript_17199/g.56986 Transcript_17199/m.56986 type:complete len:81 (+) Transcript_17199:4340-4582(+)
MLKLVRLVLGFPNPLTKQYTHLRCLLGKPTVLSLGFLKCPHKILEFAISFSLGFCECIYEIVHLIHVVLFHRPELSTCPA